MATDSYFTKELQKLYTTKQNKEQPRGLPIAPFMILYKHLEHKVYIGSFLTIQRQLKGTLSNAADFYGYKYKVVAKMLNRIPLGEYRWHTIAQYIFEITPDIQSSLNTKSQKPHKDNRM